MARVPAARIARRANDGDLVCLHGYDFPPARGGPMFHARQAGFEKMLAETRRNAANPHGDPGFWRPAPLVVQAARTDKWPR